MITDIIINIIHCKTHKSRLSKENVMVDTRLRYETGLDRHYGLLDLALKHDIFKQVSTRIELPDIQVNNIRKLYRMNQRNISQRNYEATRRSS